MRITHNLHFGQVKVEDFTKDAGGAHPFVVVELCHDDKISDAALYLYKAAECDELIKALAAAKSMLLGETSDSVPQGDMPLCGEAKAGVGGVMCTRPADHAGGHKHEYSGAYWPRHDGGSEDLDAALGPPGYSLPASELSEDAPLEPDDELRCDAPREGFNCTRTRGHAGDHVAHGGFPLRPLDSWPQAPAKADVR